MVHIISAILPSRKMKTSVVHIQAEPYLHSGMGQVSFYQEALKFCFSLGVDFKR